MYPINFPLNERCLDIVSVNKRNIGDRERTECSLVIYFFECYSYLIIKKDMHRRIPMQINEKETEN